MKRLIGVFLFIICLCPVPLLATNLGEILIITDIGPYKLEQPFVTTDGLVIGGGEPKSGRYGNEAEGYHTSYSIGYDGGDNYIGPDVEVRVYDSTQWMLHELESRNKEIYNNEHKSVDGRTTDSCGIKVIDGNRVAWNGAGGGYYFWVNNNVAVIVKYIDLNLKYPEPVEVIKEYLKKYPSTLSTYKMNETRDKEYILEEFDRLLWVSDRWVSLIQDGDPKLKEKLGAAADNLAEFARYRRAYFKPLFGDPMAEDIELLETSHMRHGQEELVRAKLVEYKEWWAGHKSDAINFP